MIKCRTCLSEKGLFIEIACHHEALDIEHITFDGVYCSTCFEEQLEKLKKAGFIVDLITKQQLRIK